LTARRLDETSRDGRWRRLDQLSQDDALLFTELARLGWQVETLIWNRPQALWASYRHVLLRACWDSHLYPGAFTSLAGTAKPGPDHRLEIRPKWFRGT